MALFLSLKGLRHQHTTVMLQIPE